MASLQVWTADSEGTKRYIPKDLPMARTGFDIGIGISEAVYLGSPDNHTCFEENASAKQHTHKAENRMPTDCRRRNKHAVDDNNAASWVQTAFQVYLLLNATIKYRDRSCICRLLLRFGPAQKQAPTIPHLASAGPHAPSTLNDADISWTTSRYEPTEPM